MSHAIPPRLLAPGIRALFMWAFAPYPDWGRVRHRLELATAWPGAPRGVRITQDMLGGVRTEVLRPPTTDADVTLLYFHGGGYTTGSPRTHRGVAGRLAVTMAATTYVVDYRLAPEHPCPAAALDALAAYRGLLDRGVPARQIAVAGDSAGGGLSLTLALDARNEGLPIPAVLGLICPGVDASPAALHDLADRTPDAILDKRLVSAFLDAYLGDLDPGLPASVVSPLHADLAGLPPMVIESASNDLIVSHARELASRARAAGVSVQYREHLGLWHVFHAMAGVMPRAGHALDDLARNLVRTIKDHPVALN